MDGIDERLARSITEGVLEPRPWATFVKELRAHFGGNYACTFLRRPGQPQSLEVFDAEGLSPDHHQRYFSHFKDKDPTRYQSLKPGSAFTIGDLMAKTEEREFYEDFLLPSGMADYMICCVEEPSGFKAWMVITRAPGEPAFSRQSRVALEMIARHLSSALQVFAALKRAEVEQFVHARATRSLAVGIVMLDQTGRVVDMDDVARRSLERQSELRVDGGRLRLRDRKLDGELRERIHKLMQYPLGLERSMMMDVGGDAHLELLLCTVDPGLGYSTESAPRMAVYVSSGADAVVADAWQLAELFQLTHREAALAGLLAQGLTLSDAAQHLGITEQTARTYSKRIFLKIGVRRQTELVRRILTSVARLSAISETRESPLPPPGPRALNSHPHH